MGSEADGTFQQRAWQLVVGPPEGEQSLVVTQSSVLELKLTGTVATGEGADDVFLIEETWLASDGIGDVVQEQRTFKKTKR